jgi:hypothetical protein
MLSAIEYPHWLMLAGVVLVLAGLVGLAFHKNRQTSDDNARKPEVPNTIRTAVESDGDTKE